MPLASFCIGTTLFTVSYIGTALLDIVPFVSHIIGDPCLHSIVRYCGTLVVHGISC